MTLFGNKKAKNFNGRRVGQPLMNGMNGLNGNAMLSNANALGANVLNALNARNGNANMNGYNANVDVLDVDADMYYNANGTPNPNGFYSGRTISGSLGVTNPSGEISREIAAPFTVNQLSEEDTVNQIEQLTGVDVDVAINPETGSRVFSLSDSLSGAQVVTNMPLPAAAVSEDNVCEFPAQSVQLVRDIFITNTPSQIIDVQTDYCGNTVQYTESMTRNMNATEWRSVNQSQLNGPIRQFSVNDQGTIINGSGNIRLANSPNLNGFSAPQQTVSQQLVGGRRKVHSSNKNAAFGAQKMTHWKGA